MLTAWRHARNKKGEKKRQEAVERVVPVDMLRKVQLFIRSMHPQTITLKDTPERTDNAVKQHDILGILPYVRYVYADRFPAEKGGGIAGCRNSHVLAIKWALAQDPHLKFAWIQEDDFQWTADAIPVLAQLADFMTANPSFEPDMIKLYGFIPQTLACEDGKWSQGPLLKRCFSNSTLGYIISRKFMERIITTDMNSYNCHVDWIYGRMTTDAFLLQPSPIEYNSKMESNIRWGNTMGAIVAQDIYQKVLDQGTLEKILHTYNTMQQKLGLYKPSALLSMLDGSQPNPSERSRFLKDLAVPLSDYDEIYRASKAGKGNLFAAVDGSSNSQSKETICVFWNKS